MEKFKTFKKALAYQRVGDTYNSVKGWSSGHDLIDSVPFTIGENVWLIVSEDSYFDTYEESITMYGVDASGRWVAVSGGHCSCYGWEEMTAGDETVYDTLDDLLRADPKAKVITANKGNLKAMFPFLKF